MYNVLQAYRISCLPNIYYIITDRYSIFPMLSNPNSKSTIYLLLVESTFVRGLVRLRSWISRHSKTITTKFCRLSAP